MLTDKQSLYLCAFVVFGFMLSGMLGILDSYITLGVLGLCFLVVLVNIAMHYPFNDEQDDSEE